VCLLALMEQWGPRACLCKGMDFSGILGCGVGDCGAAGSMELNASVCAGKQDLTTNSGE
jgi:hypothetical protein